MLSHPKVRVFVGYLAYITKLRQMQLDRSIM